MKEWIERVRGTLSVCAKWVMLATAVGSVVGVMGVVFHFAVEIATHQRMEHPWLLLLLPLGGVLIALLYQKTGMEKDMGTNTILEAVRGEQPEPKAEPEEDEESEQPQPRQEGEQEDERVD